MPRGNGQIHCHVSLLSLCNQTVGGTICTSIIYLMIHFHVSTCCWQYAVILLCSTEALQSSTYPTAKRGKSVAFWAFTYISIKIREEYKGFTSRNLNNSEQLKHHGLLYTCFKNWKILVRGFPGPPFLFPSPPRIHQDTASVCKFSFTHPKLLKCRVLISN